MARFLLTAAALAVAVYCLVLAGRWAKSHTPEDVCGSTPSLTNPSDYVAEGVTVTCNARPMALVGWYKKEKCEDKPTGKKVPNWVRERWSIPMNTSAPIPDGVTFQRMDREGAPYMVKRVQKGFIEEVEYVCTDINAPAIPPCATDDNAHGTNGKIEGKRLMQAYPNADYRQLDISACPKGTVFPRGTQFFADRWPTNNLGK